MTKNWIRYTGISLALVCALGLNAVNSIAATDGTLGALSSGTVDLSIQAGNIVMGSTFSDFTVPPWSPGDGDVNLAQNVCVYANNPGGDYQVLATSANGAGGLWQLTNGTGFLAYNVGWVDAPGGTYAGNTAGVAFADAVISVNQDDAEQVDSACGGGPTASLVINISSASLTAAADGVYADTLTVQIVPN